MDPRNTNEMFPLYILIMMATHACMEPVPHDGRGEIGVEDIGDDPIVVGSGVAHVGDKEEDLAVDGSGGSGDMKAMIAGCSRRQQKVTMMLKMGTSMKMTMKIMTTRFAMFQKILQDVKTGFEMNYYYYHLALKNIEFIF